MKNALPLVLAVLLGLAAVFAVGRYMARNAQVDEEKVSVAAATRPLSVGEIISEGAFMPKSIARSAAPAQAIPWSRAKMLVGQKTLHPISAGDYIMLDAVGLTRSMGNVVGDGEWAVSVAFADQALLKVLQPGDEIAVIGSFNVGDPMKSQSGGASSPQQAVTLVLLPRVRVLDIPSSKGGQGGGVLIVALPPAQAQMLVAAQRSGELYPALRRPNDESALNRLDAGKIDQTTFNALTEGLETVKIPNIPTKDSKK